MTSVDLERYMSHLSQVEADKRTSTMGPEVKASRIWLKWQSSTLHE